MKQPIGHKHNLPVTPMPFRLSRTLLGIVSTTVLLAVLTGFSTFNNIRREQDRMAQFLYQKGETIIHAIEAGNRTSMMHNMGNGNALHTLLNESIKGNGIAFIRIIDNQGADVDESGTLPTGIKLQTEEVRHILATQQPVVRLDLKSHLYVISSLFQPNRHFPRRAMAGYHRMPMGMMMDDTGPQIISVGLFTDALENARSQDVHHALIMGAILFLVGSAGIYFIFVYQEVRVSKAHLSDLKLYTNNVIESMPAGLITMDNQGRILSCNHMAEKIFDESRDDLQEMNIENLLPELSFDNGAKQVEIPDQPGEIHTNKDSIVPVQISGSSLHNSAGEVIGTVLIIRDMSLFRDMELQLERSRRMAALGKMAAGIAHEIRNPLGTLRGFAQYFGEKDGFTEEDTGYARLMISEVDRLNRIVSGLLQFARPRDLQLAVCNLDEMIAKVATLMKADFANHRIKFRRPDSTAISIVCDPDLVLQVLMNLLQNSITATPAGGEIILSVCEDNQHIRMSVKDSGCGMAPRDREKMFDPFFTTNKKGTGLGLAISHQIIEQHKGCFEVVTGINHGTTITVILPKIESLA